MVCRSWRLVFAAAFLGSLVASKSRHWLGGDYLVGIAFATWMPSLLGPWRKPGWWVRFATAISEFSYTLYVVHFPILFFGAAVVLRGRQFAPGHEAMTWFAGLSLCAIAVSAGMWWLFERNTEWVRATALRAAGWAASVTAQDRRLRIED